MGQEPRAGPGRCVAVRSVGREEAGKMLRAEKASGAGSESAPRSADTVGRAPWGQASACTPAPTSCLYLGPLGPRQLPLTLPSLPPAEPAPTVCLRV